MGPALAFFADGAAAILYRYLVSSPLRVFCDAALILLYRLCPFAFGLCLRMEQNLDALFAGAGVLGKWRTKSSGFTDFSDIHLLVISLEP
jgi:hypothetical protein